MKTDNELAKSFAAAYTTAIRDQIRFMGRETAQKARFSIPLWEFLVPGPGLTFKVAWLALLQSLALWTTLENSPDLRKDEKFCKKTIRLLQEYTETLYQKKYFSKLKDEQWQLYQAAQRQLNRIALADNSMRYDFAQRFLELIHGKDSPKITPEVRDDMEKELAGSVKVFESIYQIAIKNRK